ncbi:MAG TPA: N-methyl-L-tryptophan oxidase [Roseiflexaceae bacterium]|nr:N-methyl-L-tryptophan oxidase [Roseiflexaceae bacterium]
MRSDYEYIVLGLGGIGSAAAYWLARASGGNVLGLEQFAIGHVRGASQDHSRIIRLSYHTPGYVALARQAYAAWAELERDAGEKLILRTGGLDFGPRDGAISIGDYAASLRAENVQFELLDAGEIMRRWPQFQLDDSIHGMYQAESGIAPAARCNAAHIRMARAHGATLREHAPVTSLRAVDGEIEVAAAEQTYRCRKLVVAADAWTNAALAHFGVQLPLTITQEQVTYFATQQLAAFAPERFPVWIWMDDPSYYGFPVYGEAGVKAAQDVGGVEVTPETRTFEPDTAALQRVEQFLRRYIPSAVGPIIYTKSCLYTLTPDRDFVLDSLPEHPNVMVALGAAHGFKFAGLFGKILSELAIHGATASDIAPFAIDRPILLQANPPKHFMS